MHSRRRLLFNVSHALIRARTVGFGNVLTMKHLIHLQRKLPARLSAYRGKPRRPTLGPARHREQPQSAEGWPIGESRLAIRRASRPRA